ncbi:MAG: carbohydrate binding domain-containing protein [Candidatus Poribacteria bacterium]|nr:carbohydrate binding domain-containing protein [Candidatus Poribacteria bacterium]
MTKQESHDFNRGSIKITQYCTSERYYASLLALSILLFGVIPLSYAAKPPENILNNGDFDLNLERWHHWTHADAAALFQTEGKKAEPVVGKKVAYVKISKAGNAVWHVQFYQQPFTLEKGTTYTYSLWAKSEKPRTVVMRILHQGDPWNEYARQTINLSEAWTEFFITFKMPADDVSSRAGIIMGGQKVDVWLDHIRLYEGEFVSDIEGTKPHSVEPTNKLATTWATLKDL